MSFLGKLGNVLEGFAGPAIGVGTSALLGAGNPFAGEALKQTLLTMGVGGLGGLAKGEEEKRMREAQRQAEENQARANLINAINPRARAQARPVEMPKAGLMETVARGGVQGYDFFKKAEMAAQAAKAMKNRLAKDAFEKAKRTGEMAAAANFGRGQELVDAPTTVADTLANRRGVTQLGEFGPRGQVNPFASDPTGRISAGAAGAAPDTTGALTGPVKSVSDVYPGGAPVRDAQEASKEALEEMGMDRDEIYAKLGRTPPIEPKGGTHITTSLGRQIGGPPLSPEELKKFNNHNRWRRQKQQLRGAPGYEVDSPEWDKLKALRMEQWGWDGDETPITPLSLQKPVESALPGGPAAELPLDSEAATLPQEPTAELPSVVDPFPQRPLSLTNIPTDTSLAGGQPSSIGLQVTPYERRVLQDVENPFDRETQPTEYGSYEQETRRLQADADVAARAEEQIKMQRERLDHDKMAMEATTANNELLAETQGQIRTDQFLDKHAERLDKNPVLIKYAENQANLTTTIEAINGMIESGERITGNQQGMMLRVIQRAVDNAQVTEKDLAITQALQGKWAALELKFKDWTGTESPKIIGDDEISDMVYFLEQTNKAVENAARKSIGAYAESLRLAEYSQPHLIDRVEKSGFARYQLTAETTPAVYTGEYEGELDALNTAKAAMELVTNIEPEQRTVNFRNVNPIEAEASSSNVMGAIGREDPNAFRLYEGGLRWKENPNMPWGGSITGDLSILPDFNPLKDWLDQPKPGRP